MKYPSIEEAISLIVQTDPRYDGEAYLFVKDALDFTVKSLRKPTDGPGRHVSGEELLQGIRDYALQQFGPVTLRVLNTWGIHTTADFGEIVFNMVEHGILGKTDEDTREDFKQGYDFNTAFCAPFLPATGAGLPSVESFRRSSISNPLQTNDPA